MSGNWSTLRFAIAIGLLAAFGTSNARGQGLNLEATPFRIGETSTVTTTLGNPGWTNFLLLDFETGDTSLHGNWFGLAFSPMFAILHRAPFNGAGSTSLDLGMPNDMDLLGFVFYLQSAAVNPDGFGRETSNRVDAVIQSAASGPAVEAAIDSPPDPMTIAPYTAMFSGLDSTSSGSEIVRWEWDFGDSSSIDPKTDEGMLAAHRFDNPGNYTVRLTVVDEDGFSDTTSMNLSVQPFTGTTYYVSTSGNDSNNGLSSNTPWRTLDHAFANAEGSRNQPNRILLKRGDKWSHTSSSNLSVPAPMILDAYGSGDKPRIEFTKVDSGLNLGDSREWGYSIRVHNLHLKHTGGPRQTKDLLITKRHGNEIRGCIVENGGLYCSGHSGNVQLLVIDDTEVSHGVRMGLYAQWTDWVTIRDSYSYGAGSDKKYDHQLYYHEVKKLLIEDTKFEGSTGIHNFAAKINACSDVLFERCEAVRVRNGFSIGSNSGDRASENVVVNESVMRENGSDNQGSGIYVSKVKDLTVQNCLIYNNNRSPDWGLAGIQFTATDPGSKCRILNNTFYSNDIPDIRFTSDQDWTIEVMNNIFYRNTQNRTYEGFYKLDANQVNNLVSDYNCFFWTGKDPNDKTFSIDADEPNLSFQGWKSRGHDQNSVYGDPKFSNASQGDFRLNGGSAAVDQGLDLGQVYRDLEGTARPAGPVSDMGAYERD